MSGMGNGSDLATDRNDAPAGARAATEAAATDAVDAADATASAGTEPAAKDPAGTTGSPAPLISLTSLLGGSIEGGTSCAADGTCD